MSHTRDEFFSYFDTLNGELEFRGITYDALIAGGSSMVLYHGGRTRADDVDLIAASTSEEFGHAVLFTASRHTLHESWMNNAAYMFAPKGEIEGIPVYVGSHLSVSVVPLECLLAMKVISSRPKDKKDIAYLAEKCGITTQEDLGKLVHRYYPNIPVTRFMRSPTACQFQPSDESVALSTVELEMQ